LHHDGVTETTATREIWEEVIPEFKKMWMQDEYEGFDGKWWSLPPRKILPKPYYKPHPPMWYAAGNTSSYAMAAGMGLGVLGFSVGSFAALEPVVKAYKDNIVNAEPVGAYVNDNIMVTTGAYVAETDEAARAALLAPHSSYLGSNVYRYHDTFPHPPEIPMWPDLIPDFTPEVIDYSITQGAIIGTPDLALEQCRRWESMGADQISFGIGTATTEQSLETIRLMGEYVIPKIDTDPVHRSTRMREAAAKSLA
jgi:alkanesulfonate monooxygenase SsuD/methylene tetrahydromethanopterin reductase-like flavin-dependent oxidoreductase (luciferase family)